MHIVFCAEPGYFQHAAVAMASLLHAHPGVRLHLHLLCSREDRDVEGQLRAVVAGHPTADLTIHPVPEAMLDGVFVDKYLTRETYMRLLVAEVLPRRITRVLYLDSDLVVLADLQPLAAIELGSNVIAAAPDYPMVPQVVDPRRLAALGIPPGGIYVNAGVLLIDLDAWRREDLTRKLMAFVNERGAELEFHDQDAINAVLHDRILRLDCRWNLQARMLRCGRRVHPVEFEAVRDARRNPAILHYVGAEKPWNFRTRVARKRDYDRFLAKTAWHGAHPPLRTPLEKLEWRFDRAMARAGVDYLHVLWRLRRVPVLARRLVRAAIKSSRIPKENLR